MGQRTRIMVDDLSVKIHTLWADQWFLLTSGDFAAGQFNTMTVAWGSTGIMWEKPFVQVVVRPTRYTFEFMERYDSFTLSAFVPAYREKLLFLGSRSGRDLDKIAESGLTPIASSTVAAPGFAEAELIIECRKIYWHDLDPSRFLTPEIDRNYPDRDYHRAYFGEVVELWGDPAHWSAK